MQTSTKDFGSKKLNARDLAFGIGRKASSQELQELIENTKHDDFISLNAFEKKIVNKKSKNELANKIK